MKAPATMLRKSCLIKTWLALELTSVYHSYNQWTGRRHEWNKKWNIADSSRGSSLSTPPELLDFQIWFESLQFAGEYKPHETVSGESYVYKNPIDRIS